jgi:L-asparaginase/beta-aspartyl-peptidase (threonine type)
MAGRMIIVHGGVGNSPANLDGCRAAAEAGMAEMRRGADSLTGAVAAAVVLEDDPRFNAGTGSSLLMDGETICMDASIMDSRGRLGAVANLQKIKNPVKVARAIADTPHWMLIGEGARAFALKMGFEEAYEITEKARTTYNRVMAQLAAGVGEDVVGAWQTFDIATHWNFRKPWEDVIKQYGSSTIGAVAMDADGHFAAASSTGGSSPMLFGRVGDTPIVGCGYYVGEHGAIAATGIGEYIVKTQLCSLVYRWIEGGMDPQAALDKGVGLYPHEIDIGLIAVTKGGPVTSDNRQMPTASLVE